MESRDILLVWASCLLNVSHSSQIFWLKGIRPVLLLSIMHGLCRQGSRCHHSLAARTMVCNLIFCVPLCLAVSSVFPFLFILVANCILMLQCTTNAAITHQLLVWSYRVALWSSQSFLILLFASFWLWPSFCPFLFVAKSSSLRKQRLTKSLLLSFQCTNSVSVSLQPVLHHRFCVVASLSPRPFRHYFDAISISLFLHHCFLVAASSPLSPRHRVFVTCSLPAFFVSILSLLLLPRHFLITLSLSSCFRYPVLIRISPNHIFVSYIVVISSPLILDHRFFIAVLSSAFFFPIIRLNFSIAILVCVFSFPALFPLFPWPHAIVAKLPIPFLCLHLFLALSSLHSRCHRTFGQVSSLAFLSDCVSW